ncbi:hypothetical protein BDN72DRAFT_841146 [Pluteus cervinus]|uniref:Uncharacterized protein n=1 Tax=Pluteus cervinus TaxID=181527 RepID=A0ACD3AUB8_9AGAR|nr:hypothetical protein BDN72DRAFT_841146 [Pluteus cervinus]
MSAFENVVGGYKHSGAAGGGGIMGFGRRVGWKKLAIGVFVMIGLVYVVGPRASVPAGWVYGDDGMWMFFRFEACSFDDFWCSAFVSCGSRREPGAG